MVLQVAASGSCRTEEVFRAGAEEQFVTVGILLAIQNWLARDIAR